MITLMAAVSDNNVIGKAGTIPWNIPEDYERMTRETQGKVLIMGRKTWESIPAKRRPLAGRTNVVITQEPPKIFPPGVEVYKTVAEAIEKHAGEEIIGFGGQKIYEAMLPLADALDITHVHQSIPNADAFFPTIDPMVWQETWREDHTGFSFVTYARR